MSKIIEEKAEHRQKIKAKVRKYPLGPPGPLGRVWSQTGSCYHSLFNIQDGPVAMFDLDCTLMKLNSTELITETIEYAKVCRDAGQQLVVISNQYGITKGRTTHDEVRARFKVLDDALGPGVRVSYMYSTGKDHYRKPMTGMFDILCQRCKPFLEESFYCGDTVGRPMDFAVSDLYFAHNCGVRCTKPPDGSPVNDQSVATKFRLYANPDARLCLEPLDNWVINGDHLIQFPKLASDPLLVMMVGPQGSGKSQLSKMLVKQYPDRFNVLNRDTIGSTDKMNTEFHRLVKEGNGIILDNTNYDQDKRKYYLKEAIGYQVCIYYFDIPKDLCFHMCHMRVQVGGPRIPPVAIHTYYKRLQPPTDTQGEIIRIGGIPSYSDAPITNLSQFYYHYDLKEC